MIKRIALATFLTGLLTLSSLVAANSIVSLSSLRLTVAPDEAIVSIDKVTKEILSTFDVNINVTNAVNVKGFTIDLNYSKDFVKVLNVTKGNLPYLSDIELFSVIDPYTGLLTQVRTLAEARHPVNATGILAIVTFLCFSVGGCNLELQNTTKLKIDVSGSLVDVPPIRQNGRIDVVNPSKPIQVKGNYTLAAEIPKEIDISLPSSVLYLFEIVADNTTFDLKDHQIRSLNPIGSGIEIDQKTNVTIMNGVIIGFQKGLIVQHCTNIALANVNVMASTTKTSQSAISITSSNNVQVINSEISGHQQRGISVESQSNHVNIANNTIKDNSIGVYLFDSTNCNVSENKIIENKQIGLQLDGLSFDNRIWNNNFEKNTRPVAISQQSLYRNNQWNTDYPSGGNFWDKVNLTDSLSGTNLTRTRIPGPDGIGDEAYDVTPDVRDDDNWDMYPWKYEYGLTGSGPKLKLFSSCCTVRNETRTNMVGLYTNAWPIKSFLFEKTQNAYGVCGGSITFNASNWNFCKAIIPRELLDGVFEVFVNEAPVPCVLNWEGNLTCGFAYLNFTYNGSGECTIKINGQLTTRLYCDLNDDGVVNIIDISIVAKNRWPST